MKPGVTKNNVIAKIVYYEALTRKSVSLEGKGNCLCALHGHSVAYGGHVYKLTMGRGRHSAVTNTTADKITAGTSVYKRVTFPTVNVNFYTR